MPLADEYAHTSMAVVRQIPYFASLQMEVGPQACASLRQIRRPSGVELASRGVVCGQIFQILDIFRIFHQDTQRSVGTATIF